jgi:hypothetical protein
MAHMQSMTATMRECIQTCLECHSICKETITHCLTMGGEYASAEHQRILADCAQACIICADFMLRLSQYHPEYCGACANICLGCAESCERLGRQDETMRKCAATCRRCEQFCRRMSGRAAA